MGSSSSFVANLAIIVTVSTCLLLSSAAFLCESHLRFISHHSHSSQDEDGSSSMADTMCLTWALWMRQVMSHILHEDDASSSNVVGTNRKTEGLFVLGVAFPFFLASTTVYVFSLLQKKKKKKKGNNEHEQSRLFSSNAQNKHQGSSKLWTLGDPPVQWWSFLVLFLPTTLICADVLWHAPEKNSRMNNNSSSIASFLMQYGMLLANPFGVAASISLSFFLVPVARGSYTIEWESGLWSWSPMHALVFHRMAGWSSAFFTGLHASVFCALYIMSGVKYHHQAPLAALWSALVPGRECWPSWFPWLWPSHASASFVGCLSRDKLLLLHSRNRTIEDCLESEQHEHEHEHEHAEAMSRQQCYGNWRNFMGTISALAFLVLCLTSLPVVRRHFYSLFYKTHIVAGSMMLVFAILHFETVLMYLFPSMVYYLATTIPTVVQQYWSCQEEGVCIKNIKFVEDSGGCVEVTLPMPARQHQCFPAANDDEDNNNSILNCSPLSTPVYARICVPTLSLIWHPFSVMIKPKNTTRDDRPIQLFGSSSPPSSSSSTASLTHDEEAEDRPTDPLRMNCDDLEGDYRCENRTEDDDYEVVILFRSIGPFTKSWAKSLLPTMARENEEEPTIGTTESPHHPNNLLLDGFYPGAFPIPKIMQRHDVLVLMAGGVGIVPFISVLQAWYHCRTQECNKKQRRQQGQVDSEQHEHDPTVNQRFVLPQKLVLYWSCREPGLVTHFLDHHLTFLWKSKEMHSNSSSRQFDDNSHNPSIQIFCHLTRGGGLERMLPPNNNEQAELQQPLLSDEPSSSLPSMMLPFVDSSPRITKEEEEGTLPSSMSTATSCSLTQRLCSSSSMSSSVEVEASSRDPSGSSTTNSPPGRRRGHCLQVARFDWISFGVFALILWFNFLVQAWQYSRRILVQESSISIRCNSIYTSLVWSVLVALCGEYVRTWYSRKQHVSGELEEDNTPLPYRIRCSQGQRREEEQMSCVPSNGHSTRRRRRRCDRFPASMISDDDDSNENDPSRLDVTQFMHRSAVVGVVSVSIVAGRPDLQDIVKPIGSADCPAVLLCGPKTLRENVRRIIRHNGTGTQKCSIYEEVSEM